ETSEKFEIVKEALKGAVTLEKDKITKPICREYLLLEKLDEYINSKAFMRLVHDEKIQQEVARYIAAYDHDHQEDDSCEIKQGDAKKIQRKMENYKKLERYMQRVKKDFEKEVLLQMEYILSFFVEESIIAEIEERDIKSIRKTLPFLRPDGIQPTATGRWDTVKQYVIEAPARLSRNAMEAPARLSRNVMEAPARMRQNVKRLKKGLTVIGRGIKIIPARAKQSVMGFTARAGALFTRREQTVMAGQDVVEGEQTPVAGEQTPVAGEQTPVAGEQTPVEGEQTPVEGEQTPVAGQDVVVEQTPEELAAEERRAEAKEPKGLGEYTSEAARQAEMDRRDLVDPVLLTTKEILERDSTESKEKPQPKYRMKYYHEPKDFLTGEKKEEVDR
ncbi:MAG: uncharacterized protein A8A55_3243, partial [Amphiamblys sp. WSBS2006]